MAFFPIVAPLVALPILYLLYNVIAFYINDIRFKRWAKQNGAEPAVMSVDKWPGGVDRIYKLITYKGDLLEDLIFKRFTDDMKAWTFGVARLFGGVGYMTADPKVAQAVLATNFKDFDLGYIRNNAFSKLLGWSIFTSDGPRWEYHRAMLRPAFARENLNNVAITEKHVGYMFKALPVNADGWTDTVNLAEYLIRLSLDVATDFLFGESVHSQLHALAGSDRGAASDLTQDFKGLQVGSDKFDAMFEIAESGSITRLFLQNLFWAYQPKKFRDACNFCRNFVDHYVKLALDPSRREAAKKVAGTERETFLDALAAETQDADAIRDQLISLLVAGRDTTGTLLSWTFACLVRHPDIYARLRSEVLEMYPDDEPITFAKLKSHRYMQAILNETLRLYPPVPVNGRTANKDTILSVGGGSDGTKPLAVKKGNPVSYSAYVIHRREDLWGEDAPNFNPDRWDSKKISWDYIPFNAGPRICIGQQFALSEASLTLVRMLQRFERIELRREDPGAGQTVRLCVNAQGWC